MVAPPPSGEFQIVLSKPFNGKLPVVKRRSTHTNQVCKGAPTHMIEVIGEPNRSASIRMSNYNGNSKSSEKKGDVPQYVNQSTAHPTREAPRADLPSPEMTSVSSCH
jgi:hypothetical protein